MGSFDWTDESSLDFFDLNVSDETSSSRKRGRELNNFLFDFELEHDESNEKKIKLENDIHDLMDAEFVDDDFTSSWEECSIPDNDFDLDNLLLDDDADFVTTPLTAPVRNNSVNTPPLSPAAEDELCPVRDLSESMKESCAPKHNQSSCTTSTLSVLCDEIFDLDTIADRVDDSALALPMPNDLADCRLQDSVDMRKDKKISSTVRRVGVEERTLSTKQKAKHAQWIRKRKRCLTGHKGYKCPAKSVAAKKKIRANGRFDLRPI